MFHLPKEIIRLIYEFDHTYREEYRKSLDILDNFPAYNQIGKPNYLRNSFSMIYTYYIYSSPITFIGISIHPPGKCYFNILKRNKKELIAVK